MYYINSFASKRPIQHLFFKVVLKIYGSNLADFQDEIVHLLFFLYVTLRSEIVNYFGFVLNINTYEMN